MATRKRLADVIQEEAHKTSSPEIETVIDVTAEAIIEEPNSETDESSTKSKRTTPTKADLEITVEQLQTSLEQTHQNEEKLQQQISDLQSALSEKDDAIKKVQNSLEKTHQNEEDSRQQIGKLQSTLSEKDATIRNLQASLEKNHQNEEDFRHQIGKLQSALSEQDIFTERLIKELEEAKKAILQLAESNSKLTEEINSLKKDKQTPKALTYRKSHRATEKLPLKPPTSPTEPVDNNSNQMWLLD